MTTIKTIMTASAKVNPSEIGGKVTNHKTGQVGRLVAARLIKSERKIHYCGKTQWMHTTELTIEL